MSPLGSRRYLRQHWLTSGLLALGAIAASSSASLSAAASEDVTYKTVGVDGLKLFYREAGPPNAPTVLLLHGFPTSSHMFRDLIPKLAVRYHVVAPDYPGYGFSDAPPVEQFTYSFDRLTDVIERFTEKLGLTRYSLYMQDFGGPVGFRLATRHPDRVEALIIQNAVAHLEGLSDGFEPARAFWKNRNAETEKPMRDLLTIETTKFQYLHGASRPERVSPDSWTLDQALLDRPGNAEIQLALLYDYRNNPPRYEDWQAYLRDRRPPTLVVWGRNDPFFTVAGANAYKRDVPEAELHVFDGGHFVLEEYSTEIATLIKTFLGTHLPARAK
ncbi:alpha/beta hydrolase [Rhodospirillaceae bacterium SYSU D60014]|uniref:alpha/beta fold hydrolase n=1 Tax=Virgifigura deserti TaxID=2268457 RepID=UPI000E664B03